MKKKLFQLFNDSEFYSTKHINYFSNYELLLEKYIGKHITFIEVGVFSGGSLFMWRNFFGSSARIIGIEINPLSKHLERFGFEIFIGDAGNKEFWRDFYKKVGCVDVVIDDGSHSSHDQVIGVTESLQHINDGGLYIVEDIHSNYLKKYGCGGGRYRYIDFAKNNIDHINYRFPETIKKENKYMKVITDKVYSIRFFESMVAYEVDKSKCKENKPINNGGKIIQLHHEFNYLNESKLKKMMIFFSKKFKFLKKITFFFYLTKKMHSFLNWYLRNKQNKKLKKFFK